MKKILLPLLATAFIAVTAFSQDARPQRGSDRPQINREEVSKARELISSDAELKKIQEKYQAALIKRLKELGVSEETAKMIAQPRSGRGPAFGGDRRGGERPSGAVRPDSPRRERKKD